MPFYYRCDRCLDEEEVGIMKWTREESCDECGQSCCTAHCIRDGKCEDCRKQALDNEDDGA